MDTLESYRQIIEKILSEYAAIPYAYGDIKSEVVFDSTNNRYLLVNVGWHGERILSWLYSSYRHHQWQSLDSA